MDVTLEARNITKRFSGVTALDRVNLQLRKGRVLALIGENGAGKSTLLKIMSGIHTTYEGSIYFQQQKVRFASPKEAQELGIAIIHQELHLIPELTVAQNVFLGRELTQQWGFLEEEQMLEKTAALLERLQSDISPSARVGSLKVGQQQIVEIAKALLTSAPVLFMDEPTSAIGEQEIDTLFQLIHQLREAGHSIVYISHKLEELYTIADDFVVLRDGQVVGQGAIADISRAELIHLMAGRETLETSQAIRQTDAKVMLQVRNLSLPNSANPHLPILQDINFDLHRGEVLGLYGLMGAGRTELCECLFGLHVHSGTIRIDDEQKHFKSPKQAIEAGMALVPEDRKHSGIIPGMSVRKNISLTVLEKLTRWGLLHAQTEAQLYKKYVESLQIKASHPDQLIKVLSGGNQQKVVLAKWIERNPKVLILDEPTRGIDVNAKGEIYTLISTLAGEGISILVVSSEIPEVLAIADRIMVMADGQLTATFDRKEATENKIMNACIPENTPS
ncbi:MAG: sugar ABC transporter ATP-binding protein [Saprospiraceae bacterium]|nr:sugar ABC transporter ATP-binding protein [Saprospiraceae bacterium]